MARRGRNEIVAEGIIKIGKQEIEPEGGIIKIGKQEIEPEGGIIKMDTTAGSGGGRRRSSRRHQHIPEEIIEEHIVVKLPVKSLFRFKAVSKSWFNLIKSNDFIYKQFNSSSTRRSLQEEEEGGSYLAMCWLFFDEFPYTRPFLDIYLHELCDAVSSVQNKKSFEIPGRPPCADLYRQFPHIRNMGLVYNCNGILCFDDNGIIMLVNPFLSELKRLPGEFLTPARPTLLGFGFDKTMMDFKVVRIFLKEKIAQVYSLRSNAWRELDETSSGLPLMLSSYDIPCKFFRGKLYWIVLTSSPGGGIGRGRLISMRILTFNLATELFQLMEYPQSFQNDKGGLYGGFIVSNQEWLPSLAFVFCSKDGLVNLSTLTTKVNNNNEEEEEEEEEEVTTDSRWTKQYSIQCSPHFYTPVCFSISKKHSTFIYLTREEESGYFHLIKYDVMNQSSSTISEPFRLGQSGASFYSCYSSFSCFSSLQGLAVCRPSLFSLNSV